MGWHVYRMMGRYAVIAHTDGRCEILPTSEAAGTVRAYNAGLAEPPAWVRPGQPGTLFGIPMESA